MKSFLIFVIVLGMLVVPGICENAPVSPMLSADGAHMLALDSSGTVWAWGSNHRGESNPADDSLRITAPVSVLDNAVSVSAGQQFSMAITQDGGLYAWGDNTYGQIFTHAEEKAASPCLIMENVVQADACDTLSVCVTKDGQAHFWGGGLESKSFPLNAVKCAAGLDFAVILTQEGHVYEITAGSNEPALLFENAVDIDASGESRYALTAEGGLYAWGASTKDGRLAMPGDTMLVTAPALVYENDHIRALHAGLTFSGFTTNENELYLWGTLYSYQTALSDAGTLEAALVNGPLLTYGSTPLRLYENVLDAAMGDAFISVLFESGDVYTWGSNDHGQLGNGSFTQTTLTENEDGDGYELEVVLSADSVFPSIPINLK